MINLIFTKKVLNFDYFWGQGVQKRYTSKSIFHDNSKNTGRKNHCNSSMKAYLILYNATKNLRENYCLKKFKGLRSFLGSLAPNLKIFSQNVFEANRIKNTI